MSQRSIEWLLGRLLTDEDLRTAFVRDPVETLALLQRQGWDLNASEVEALLSGDSTMWRDLAERIPARLRRCSLRTN
jgi:hypothetical protein